MTKHPSTPDGWATKITAALTAIHRLPFFEEISQYPVDAKAIALEFSKKYFETSYISDVQDTAFGIDGALIPFQNSKQWAILYNPDIGSSGRINFTIGHEFGHFLLHRALAPEGGFQCSKEKIENWTFPMIIEKEANAFAASLLMPNQDFRRQTGKEFPSLELVDFLSDLYQVSRTAILLRWISLCAKRAKLVCSIDGYIDWIYSSQDLRKSEAYINPKKQTLPIPESSLVLTRREAFLSYDFNAPAFFQSHPKGIWSQEEDVDELAFSYSHNGSTIGISLLVYPDEAPPRKKEGIDHSPHFRISETYRGESLSFTEEEDYQSTKQGFP